MRPPAESKFVDKSGAWEEPPRKSMGEAPIEALALPPPPPSCKSNLSQNVSLPQSSPPSVYHLRKRTNISTTNRANNPATQQGR